MAVSQRTTGATAPLAKGVKQNEPKNASKFTDGASDEFEFGGPVGATLLMTGFPLLMWYMWIGATYYDDMLPLPESNQTWAEFGRHLCQLVYEGAYPTAKAWAIYWTFFVMEALMYCYMPGVSNFGRPLRHEGGKRLPYYCSAYCSFYATLAIAATLHFTGVFPLYTLIDDFGSIMSVSILSGFLNSFIVYIQAIVRGRTHRLSGSPIYDFFMGAELNPRVGILDFKMFYEVRIPWFILFLITCSVAARQYETYGYVSAEVVFLAGAHYLYTNACAKAEEMIITTWDMYFEKLGFLLTFWNMAGVPFTYCHCALYLANHPPSEYHWNRYALAVFSVLYIFFYWMWDSANGQKNTFRHKEKGQLTKRNTFPQVPWQAIDNPKTIQTDTGDHIMVDGWFAIIRKPNYVPDMFFSMSWGLITGFKSPFPWFYSIFFMVMIIHRTNRDINRCRRKYGEAWKRYEKEVPYLFIPALTCTSHHYGISVFLSIISYTWLTRKFLSSTQRSSMKTLKFNGMDMHLIHPLDSDSIKQFTGMRHLSLMSVFHVAVGPAMGLVPASQKFLTDPDTGVFKRELSRLFNGELRNLQNLRNYASLMDQTIETYWCETFSECDSEVEIGLGSWIFDFLSRSMGAMFWGEDGPFEDDKFRNHLRLFIQNLEALRNPIPWLIPFELRSARKVVRQKMEQCVENGNYGRKQKQGVTLFERLAFLYESLEIPREGFTDCHLVAIVGLMSNVINIITWAFCEIVADSELLVSLLAEIEANVDASSPNPVIDVDQIRCSCPLLVATWYELLRTYGDSPVARGVHEDSVFNNKYQLWKGSIIMTPIHLHNFNIDIWGKDAEIFQPSRFLQKDGEVRQDLVKHLNVFGLPGMHQCPGRYLGMNLTLGMLAKALLSFNFIPTPGEALGRGILPARKDTMLGLPALSRDPRVIVRRRERIRAVHLNFDNVRPGW